MAATIVSLWVGVLFVLKFGGAAAIASGNDNMCLVNRVIDMALQLQQQSQQLKRAEEQFVKIGLLEIKLQEQAQQLQQQASLVQEQSLQLKQLQEQCGDLQDNVSSMKTRQESNTALLTQLSTAQSSQDKLLIEQSVELRSLEDRVEPIESSLEWSRQTLTALNESQSLQGQAADQQSGELRSLQDKVQAVDTDLHWITGNLTALNSSRDRPAFRAQLSKEAVVRRTPIPFTSLFTRGKGTFNNNGTYTVVTPGVYLLGFQIYPLFILSTPAYLKVNNDTMIYSRCASDANFYFTCASSSTFHLQAGDRVWVEAYNSGNYNTNKNSNFFFGFLVSPDPQ